MDQLELAALVCSRLCHDLVSPVGAISNGIEILAEENDPDMRAQTLAMLEDSAEIATAKLQFFRLAFGAGGGFGATLDLREAERTVRAFLGRGRTAIEWTSDLAEAPKDIVKTLLNLALVVGEGLVRGGTLAITIQKSAAEISLVIKADGKRFIVSDKMQSALAGELNPSDLEPKIIPAYIAYSISQTLSGKIDVPRINDTGITITASLPTI